ncbi:MAG: hypothetical protein ACJAR2_001492 [Ilumatobacter sp.]
MFQVVDKGPYRNHHGPVGHRGRPGGCELHETGCLTADDRPEDVEVCRFAGKDLREGVGHRKVAVFDARDGNRGAAVGSHPFGVFVIGERDDFEFA